MTLKPQNWLKSLREMVQMERTREPKNKLWNILKVRAQAKEQRPTTEMGKVYSLKG